MHVLLLGISDSVRVAIREGLSAEDLIDNWHFDSIHEERCNLTPMGHIHLHAWEHRYQTDLDDLSSLYNGDTWLRAMELTCDRVFLAPISNNDRLLYLAKLKSLISNELHDHKVDVAIFGSTPHFPWDLCALQVLTERGCRTFSLRPTQVDGRILVQRHRPENRTLEFVTREEIGTSYSDRNPLGEPPLGKSGAELSKRLRNATNLVDQSSYRALAKSFGVRIVKRGRPTSWLRRATGTEQGRSGVDYFSVLPKISRRGLALFQIWQVKRHIATLRPFPLFSDFQRYVAFFLHYQPERTTDPEASEARFQVSAIISLRKKMDASGLEDVLIVVKEHPRQWLSFSGDIRRLLARNTEFYRTIRSLERVEVVAPDVLPDDLVRGALLVASPNGSSVWEALCVGKPGITFAETWHSSCAASPPWCDIESGRARIDDLVRMESEEIVEHVRAFWREEEVTHTGVMDPGHVEEDELSRMQRATGLLLSRVAQNAFD